MFEVHKHAIYCRPNPNTHHHHCKVSFKNKYILYIYVAACPNPVRVGKRGGPWLTFMTYCEAVKIGADPSYKNAKETTQCSNRWSLAILNPVKVKVAFGWSLRESEKPKASAFICFGDTAYSWPLMTVIFAGHTNTLENMQNLLISSRHLFWEYSSETQKPLTHTKGYLNQKGPLLKWNTGNKI